VWGRTVVDGAEAEDRTGVEAEAGDMTGIVAVVQ